MAFGHQLPVWSPLTFGAIGAGLNPPSGVLPDLEARIRTEYGAASVLLTASGTVALALAYLASAPPGARPRVALPAWACPDLMTAADAAGAEVVLYDLDPETLGPDLDSLRRALRSGPTAVVVAHWFGLPVDLRPIAPLVKEAGAELIDDAAQGVGASVAGRPVGSGGDYGILSFGRGKGRTGGGGGALLANTPAGASRLEEIGRQRLDSATAGVLRIGRLFAQWALGRPALYALPMRIPALRLGQTIYHRAPEFRKMDSRSAAVLSRVWSFSSNEEVATRRANAERWREQLRSLHQVTMFTVSRADAEPGWLRFPLLVSEALISSFRNFRITRHGVSAGYPSPLSDLAPWTASVLPSAESFSGALLLSRNLFTLPVHQRVRRSDFEEILGCVQSL